MLAAFLAFSNGSNDNGKGVATLVRLGDASLRRALLWGTLSTIIGSLISFSFSSSLVEKFSGAVIDSKTPLSSAFFVAVLAAASAWVLLATRFGMPVSTTHSIVGAFIGAGLSGSFSVKWGVLVSKVAIPLAVSPLASLAIVYVAAFLLSPLLKPAASPACICATVTAPAGVPGAGQVMLQVGHVATCPAGSAVVTTSGISKGIHWFTSGLIGFARGWNDTPKIAALCLGSIALISGQGRPMLAFALVAVAMAAGGLVAGTRVLETLALKVTAMPRNEAYLASAVAASLVSAASWGGLGVSTTHVATGSIVGAGLKADPKKVQWKKVGELGLSWLITLPAAALMAALVGVLLRAMGQM
ncbi:MAG TPA: inorganic phosphate transporter [Myxococcaceae bacterium]|nr:inorganic phosphate transporter [Myxococcaceae bacterium]